MRFLFHPICIALAIISTFASSVPNDDPWKSAQRLISRINSDINDLIADFVQKPPNINDATFDYVILRQMFFSSLADAILDDTGCRNLGADYKIGPYPNTSTDVIQSLQKTQLGLNSVSQDLINKAGPKVIKEDYCKGAMGSFWSVSCFEGGGFAKNLNGSFEPPAAWICKQYRWNSTTIETKRPDQDAEKVLDWQQYL